MSDHNFTPDSGDGLDGDSCGVCAEPEAAHSGTDNLWPPHGRDCYCDECEAWLDNPQRWPDEPAPIEMVDQLYNALYRVDTGAPIVGPDNGIGTRTFASPAEAWEFLLGRVRKAQEWNDLMFHETGRLRSAEPGEPLRPMPDAAYREGARPIASIAGGDDALA